MRALAIIFAVAALACGLTAAHYWYRSSIVGIVVEELHNRVWFSATMNADSDEVAQAFRDDVARRSEMMSPGCDASVAADFWHSIAERSIVAGRAE